MSNTSNLQNSLFETMQIFSKYAVDKSSSTITIEGKIKDILDKGKKEYLIDYMGNAFSAHGEGEYSIGDNVYILIPDGDFEKEKVILTTVTASAESLLSSSMTSNKYSDVSDNLLTGLNSIRLSSYHTTEKKVTLEGNNLTQVLFEYLKDYRFFSLEMKVRTDLDVTQRVGGDYGIILRLPVIFNGEGGTEIQTWKDITLDTSRIHGDPYRLTTESPQKVYIKIDDVYTYDASRLPTFTYYCKGFFQDSSKTRDDIFFSDIQFKVVREKNEEYLDGYSLTLKATEGEYFARNYRTTKIITPTLFVKGKETNLTNTEIFWFKENIDVKQDSEEYVSYGGYGWQCLNKKTNIYNNSDGSTTYNYVTDIKTLEVGIDDIAASARYKCVVLYNGKIVSSVITLKNLDKKDISLESTTGSTTYIKNTGNVSISAFVPFDGDLSNNRHRIKLSWARYDNDNHYINDDENFFEYTVLNEIVNGGYRSVIQFPVSAVEITNTLYCSASLIRDDMSCTSIGTKSIQIVISEEVQFFNLTLVNNDLVYKYDADGNSPDSVSYSGPSTSKITAIPPIEYILRKADGTELTEEEYNYAKVTWKVPKNSMFMISGPKDEDDNTIISGYGKNVLLRYNIASRFNISNATVPAEFTAEFDNFTYKINTSIKFLKEGMAGSNGTSYAAMIVAGGTSPATSDPYGTLGRNGLAKNLKLVYNNNRLYYYDYIENKLIQWSNNTKKLFLRVYENGELITDTNRYDVTYSMFDNRTLKSCFSPVKSGNGVLLNLDFAPSENSFSILQAAVTIRNVDSQYGEKEMLYCYYPIEMVFSNIQGDVNNTFLPTIVGGFSEVMYASDGTNPSWDETNPFSTSLENYPNIDVKDYFNVNWSSSPHLKNKGTDNGYVYFRPDSKYNTGDSKNYVKAEFVFNNSNESKLNTKINTNNNEINNLNNRIQKDEKSLEALEVFARNYKEAEYLADLDRLEPLLVNQNESGLKLNYAEGILNKAKQYIGLQIDKDIDTRNYFTSLMNLINSNLEIIKVSYGLISSLRVDEIKKLAVPADFNEDDKALITNNINIDVAINTEYLINQVIAASNDYNLSIDVLMRSSSTYKNSYTGLIAKLKNRANYLPALTDEYTALKALYLKAVADLDNKNSLQEMKKGIQNIYVLVLKGVFSKDASGSLVVSEATKGEIKNRVSGYSSEVVYYTKQNVELRKVLTAKSNRVVAIRPIVFYYNRYEMNNFNAWDGNKVVTNDGYIVAPQAGAGRKNADNSFTGIVIGQKNLTNANGTNTGSTKVGMFGYASGVQTIFLNADDGSATFGKSGGGQIIISPAADKAELKSGNYSEQNKSGLLIDLTTPEIKFGSGNFKVTSSGHLTAKGGGSIAGWSITDTLLKSANDEIVLDSSNKKIYSGKHNALDSNTDGFYLGNNGMSVGSKVHISADGVLKVGAGASKNTGKHWTISANGNESYIGYNTNAYSGTQQNSVYMGTDGIRLGTKFKVNSAGQITATDGSIGGWQIGSNYFKSSGITIDNSGNRTGGSGGYLKNDGTVFFGNSNVYLNYNSNGLRVNGGSIIGGEINIGDGFFIADDSDIYLGDFRVDNGSEYGRALFQSIDERVGMSCEPNSKDQLWLWAGWESSSDFDFCVNASGQAHVRKEVFIGDTEVLKTLNAIKADIETIQSSYATKDWVNNQGFATKSWVEGKNYATKTWVSNEIEDAVSSIDTGSEKE